MCYTRTMNLEILITQSQKNLSDMDLEILAYVVKHQKQVQNANIIDLSKAVHVSKSSVLRMTKKLGFSGYTEFKYFLKQSDNDDKIAQTTDLIELQEKDIESTYQYLKVTNFTPICQKIGEAEAIFFFGTGYAPQRQLQEFCKSLSLVGKRVVFVPTKAELDYVMLTMTNKDLFLIASLSGETENLRENFAWLKAQKVPICAITAFSANYMSTMAEYAYHYYLTPFYVATHHFTHKSYVALDLLLDWIYREYLIFLN